MPIGTTVLVNLASSIAVVFVNAFALWLSIDNILKYAREGFRTALKVGVISGIVSFLLGLIPAFNTALAGNAALNLLYFIISALVMLFLIKKFYGLNWSETAASWLTVLVFSFVIGFVFGNFVGLITPLMG